MTNTETHPEAKGQAESNPDVKRSLVLSPNPSTALREMMGTIDVLQRIYMRETEALTTADTKSFLSMQGEKLNAAHNYQNCIHQILQRKDEMQDADPALKQELKDMQQKFSELATKNVNALKRMDRGIERLGEAIRSAAKETAQKQRAVSYDATGTMKRTDKKTVSTGISETA